MEKPVLSPNFTIEDIHKLREYNYYITKDMSPEESICQIRKEWITTIEEGGKFRRSWKK